MKFAHFDVLIAIRISNKMKRMLSEMSLEKRLSEGEIVRDAINRFLRGYGKDPGEAR